MTRDELGAGTTASEFASPRKWHRPRQITVPAFSVQPVQGATLFQENEYGFECTLGSGTFATVKLAKRHSDGQKIAIKVLTACDDEARDMASKEYRIHASFRHPHIVSMLALHMKDCHVYMCMEYCAGGAIGTHIRQHGPMNEQRAQCLFFQLLQGLDHIHCKRVVHRDLKPDNLLLDPSADTLKITDFGSATNLATNQHFSMLTARAGSALYMAPEVHFGYDWNERVDIWSSGLCFFFIMRGRVPFDMGSSKVRRVLQTGRLPHWDAKSFSVLTRNILQQCLQVAMWDRPPAMELRLHPLFRMEFGPSSSLFARQATPEERTTKDVGPKCFYSIVPRCGLICVHPFQKFALESPTVNWENNALQDLAETKCLRAIAKTYNDDVLSASADGSPTNSPKTSPTNSPKYTRLARTRMVASLKKEGTIDMIPQNFEATWSTDDL